ncbi:hypothetical protein Dda_8307 [Drechslerella dactyloides]|uniref:Uncharacterized protein n=1 Tax=Drechslerella dactyloides TaxID=74499 RepID=A0AAD6IS51_DREDA|nr:hypothetical protein Dda_8307 [Drechslerella dactyloides]
MAHFPVTGQTSVFSVLPSTNNGQVRLICNFTPLTFALSDLRYTSGPTHSAR